MIDTQKAVVFLMVLRPLISFLLFLFINKIIRCLRWEGESNNNDDNDYDYGCDNDDDDVNNDNDDMT